MSDLKKEKSQNANVTFHVPVALIQEIDAFCEKNKDSKGRLQRKSWLFDLIRKCQISDKLNKELALEIEECKKLLDSSKNVLKESNELEVLLKENISLLERQISQSKTYYENLLSDADKKNSELQEKLSKYNSFGKRLINLFSKH